MPIATVSNDLANKMNTQQKQQEQGVPVQQKQPEQPKPSVAGISEIPEVKPLGVAKPVEVKPIAEPELPPVSVPETKPLEVLTTPKVETISTPSVVTMQTPTVPTVTVDKPTAEPIQAFERKPYDTKEQEKLLKDKLQIQNLEAERRGNIEQQNIKNLFSHMTARGQDSGFINSKMLNAARTAFMNTRDDKFRNETSFTNNMFNVVRDKAAREADFNEKAYENYLNTAKDQINTFAEAGDFDTAVDVARQYAEVDDSGLFNAWLNPQYVEAKRKSFDAQNMQEFNGVRTNIMNIATNAPTEGIGFKQAKDAILSQLATNELGVMEMVDFVDSVDAGEYLGLGVSNESQEALKEYSNGQLGSDSQRFKDAFAELYIKGMNKDFEKMKTENSFGEISDEFRNSPLGLDLAKAIQNDTSGAISWTPTEGFDVSSFSLYGRDVDLNDVEQLQYLPGLDVLFEDDDGKDFGENYTYEMAESKPVSGLKENFGFYKDAYQQYHAVKRDEYESATDPVVKKNIGDSALTFQQFLEKVRADEEGKNSANVDYLVRLAQGPVINGQVGDIPLSTLKVDPRTVSTRYQGDYLNVLASDNINDANINEGVLKQILSESAVGEDYSTSGALQDLINNNKIGVVNRFDGVSGVSGRDNLIIDENHALYGENAENLLKSLNDRNEGYVVIGENIYKVNAAPGYDKQGADKENYHPVIQWTFTPLDDSGAAITARSRFSEQSIQDKIAGKHRWLERDSGASKERAKTMFNLLKGGE